MKRFAFFQYRVAFDEALPDYRPLTHAATLAAYRYLDGEQQAALQSACDALYVGRTLLDSRNGIIDSMVGYNALFLNTQLIAEMRAANP